MTGAHRHRAISPLTTLALGIAGAVAAISLLFCASARADVTVVGSVSASGLGSTLAIPGVEVQSGHGRLLAVGISTTQAVTVESVTYGSQVLSPAAQQAGHGTRAELWILSQPAVGTADLTVTLSGSAAGVIGAVSYTGVDPLNPVISQNGESQDQAVNTAGMVLNGTTQKDGMIGVFALGNTDFTGLGSLTTGLSVDLVAADVRWKHTGGVHGAVATRVGNTGQNMAQFAGIEWRWTPMGPQETNPFSQALVALRAQADGDPVADAGGPYSIAEGDPLALDGSGSTNPDGDPLGYAWDVDDDSSHGDATGAAPTLTWSQLGVLGLGDGPAVREVSLAVLDVDFLAADTATLTIANTPPDATLENSGPVLAGEDVTITHSDPSDPSIVDTAAGFRYAFDLDDDGSYDVGGGTYATAVTTPSTVLTTTEAGEHVVRAAIIDKDGGLSTHTTTVVVEPQPEEPAPPADPTPPTEPEPTPLTIAPQPPVTLTGAAVRPACIRHSRLSGRGLTATFTATGAARVHVELQRRIEVPAPRKCPRRTNRPSKPVFHVPVFSGFQETAAGANSLALPRNLRPGAYRLLLTTLDANGSAVATTRAKFAVLAEPR